MLVAVLVVETRPVVDVVKNTVVGVEIVLVMDDKSVFVVDDTPIESMVVEMALVAFVVVVKFALEPVDDRVMVAFDILLVIVVVVAMLLEWLY
jgi:hypothetical protein